MNKVNAFTYTVVRVDAENDFMELNYSSEGLPDALVGARMPRGTQTVDDIARSYAPMGYWMNLLNPIVPVEVGSTGSVVIPVSTATSSSNVV
jgi:hypothetical protein